MNLVKTCAPYFLAATLAFPLSPVHAEQPRQQQQQMSNRVLTISRAPARS